jgi:Cation efflux family
MTCRSDVLTASGALLRRGRTLEVITLGWNVAGIVVLAIAAIGARSVALAGFGLDSLIETVVLAAGYRPGHSVLGIAWTAVTAAAMFALAAGKARTGKELGNPVLTTEGRVTLVDGILAAAVLAGLVLNAAVGLWWADPLAALVIVVYALREARAIFSPPAKPRKELFSCPPPGRPCARGAGSGPGPPAGDRPGAASRPPS